MLFNDLKICEFSVNLVPEGYNVKTRKMQKVAWKCKKNYIQLTGFDYDSGYISSVPDIKSRVKSNMMLKVESVNYDNFLYAH